MLLRGAWPHMPKDAKVMAWAFPPQCAAAEENSPSAIRARLAGFSSFTSPEVQFALHGGFVLLDERNRVLAVQVLVPGEDLHFEKPRKMPARYAEHLVSGRRLQPVQLFEHL